MIRVHTEDSMSVAGKTEDNMRDTVQTEDNMSVYSHKLRII